MRPSPAESKASKRSTGLVRVACMGRTLLADPPEERTAPRVQIRETFDAFYLREFPAIVALVASMSGSRASAEDLAQNAMIKAHRHWSKISTYDKPGAWVRRVAINEATSMLRRRATEARAKLILRGERTALPPPEPHDESIWRAVERLPKKQRAAVALYYLEDMPVRDIAEVLECSEATARVHLHKGRKTLAATLERPDR